MSNKKCLKPKNLPPRIPLMVTLFWWMFLDYTNAPDWILGTIGTLLFIIWVSFIYRIYTEKWIDIFDKK